MVRAQSVTINRVVIVQVAPGLAALRVIVGKRIAEERSQNPIRR